MEGSKGRETGQETEGFYHKKSKGSIIAEQSRDISRDAEPSGDKPWNCGQF